MTDDPLWYKDAVIYQMHVKAFHDANGDGIGDFAGLTQRLDYLQELGRQHALAAAVLSVAAARRRLRHRRLPQRAPRLRHARGLPRVRHGGASTRAQGHYRAGHQSHVRPASVVSGERAARRAARPSATSTCGATTTRSSPARASSSRIPRSSNWAGIRWPASTTGIASSRTNPISTTTTRASSKRSSRSCASGWTWAWTACGSMRFRTCASARARTTRTCRRRTRC